MTSLPQLIVVTLMPPQGTTGVQTHFNQILKAAASRGHATGIVHPYDYNLLIRKTVGLVTRLLRLIDKEWVALWVRWTHYHFLKQSLGRVLATINTPVILYAQDPLSAKAALSARTNKSQRVASVVHFNVSEAYECVTIGLTKQNGCLYRHMVNNERNNLPLVDKLFFVSYFMQTIIQDRLPEVQGIAKVCLANFIENPAETNAMPALKGDIITVGTLEPRKNQGFILNVLAKCKSWGHTYSLSIIGDGQDKQALECLARKLGITNQINFLGFKPNPPDYMRTHKIYAHAALMENMPITLMEALSLSLPILASPVGGIPEIYTDGKEGYYWPLEDIDLAAGKLCELLENQQLYLEMSQNARTRFIEHYSEQALADKWLDELRNT